MTRKTRLMLALKRAGKVIAATAVAAAIAQIPDVAGAIGGAEIFVPIATAALLAVEKYLQK